MTATTAPLETIDTQLLEIPRNQLTQPAGGEYQGVPTVPELTGAERAAMTQKYAAEHPEIMKDPDWRRIAEWRAENERWARLAPPMTKCVPGGVDSRGLSIWNCSR